MRNKKIYIAIAAFIIILVIIALSPLRQKFQFFLGEFIARGSVTKNQALATQCADKNTICTVKDGEIQTKKLSDKELEAAEKQFPNEREKNIHYAKNVVTAVQAIRRYTGVGNLDLYRLNESIPSNVSYYCTLDNKCWAVDNQTHKVLPHIK